MIAILLLVLSSAEAGATPLLGSSLQPPDVKLPPPAPAVKCEPGMTVFEPDPVPLMVDKVIEYYDDENLWNKWTLRQGILVSECGFVEILNIRAEHTRMTLELQTLEAVTAMRSDFWRGAELRYQKRILELEEERAAALEPSLWDEWKGYVLFAAGVATAGLVIWGSVEVMKAQPN